MKSKLKFKGVLWLFLCFFLFSYKVSASAFDEITKGIIENDELVINSVIPKTQREAYEYINNKLYKLHKVLEEKYPMGGSYSWRCKGECNSDFSGVYTLELCYYKKVEDTTSCEKIEERDINIKFDDSKFDSNIADKISKYIEEFPEGTQYVEWLPKEHVIYIDDAELINFMVKVGYIIDGDLDNVKKRLEVLNYNAEYRNLTNNFNLFKPSMPFGNGGDIFASNGYYLLFEYNGMYYGLSDFAIRSFLLNAVYIDSDSDVSSDEKLIEAVENRLSSEFGNSITVSIGEHSWLFPMIEEINDDFFAPYGLHIDESKVVDRVVNLKINDKSYPFIVIKDSSKIKKNDTTVVTKDFMTNSSIEYDSKSIPLDSQIEIFQNLDNSNILDKLNLAKGDTFNIKLFSRTLIDYIETSGTKDFKVTIPISADLKGKDLAVYYIGDDGKIEKYDVTIDGDYATFYTKHFSEYTIGTTDSTGSSDNDSQSTDGNIKNPQTYDGIMKWIIVSIVSLLGIVVLNIKKRFN